MQKRILFIIASLWLLCLPTLLAQKEGAIWYFGDHAGLDFNQQFPRPLTDGQLNTREGVASISDKNGKLLFYTDGTTVYNRNHQVMQNGGGLLGNTSSTQSSIVVPWPKNPTKYVLFTLDQAGTPSNPGSGLKYTVVEMTGDGGLGNIPPTQKNLSLPGTSGIRFTEKIAAVKHKDGTSYWIIAHEFGNGTFDEFKLDENGLTFGAQVTEGTPHLFDPSDSNNRGATGYLKSSPKGDFLALAVEGQHFFELFSFDNGTGRIRVIAKLGAGSSEAPNAELNNAYGVEFSPTGNFLYGSTRKNGLIYQWDINTADQLTIQRSVQILRDNKNTLVGALQLGPNGKIYVSLGGQPYLGVINSPIQKNCNYIEHGTTLLDNSTELGGKSYYGLPTFLSDFFQAAKFYYESTCQNDLTRFYVSANKQTLEGLPQWLIYDSTGHIPVSKADVDPITLEGTYRFTVPGKYLIRFSVTQFGSTISQDQIITIFPLPELNFSDTTSLCKGSPAHLDAGDGAFYLWRDNNNLSVYRVRDVINPGIYFVTVTHYNGCSASDSTVVTEKPVPAFKTFSTSPAACGGTNGSINFEMEKPLDRYHILWKEFPGNSSNQASGLPGGVYKVTITEDSTGCSLVHDFSVNEENAPDVKIVANVTGLVCAGQKVTLTAEGASNFSWVNPEGSIDRIVDVYPWASTTYRVKGYSKDPNNPQSECSAFGEITITVLPYTLPQLGADRVNCEGDTITLDGGSGFTAWTWSTGGSTRYVNITETTANLVLYATDKNKCIFTDTLGILMKPLPEVHLGNEIIQCEGTPLYLSGGTGDSYLWNTPDTTSEIRVTESGTYKLTIWLNGCANSDSVKVTLKPLPEVDLGNDTTLCLSKPVKLSGGWGDSYLWSTSETTQEISTQQSGIYWLDIDLDGCVKRDSIGLDIKPLPEVNLGPDTIYCKASPIPLSGGTGDSYAWNTGATTPQILINETGTYELTLTKDGCQNADTVKIRFNDPALLIIDSVEAYPVSCPGSRDGSLRIVKHGSGLTYEYSINNGADWYDSPIFAGLYGDNNFQILVREDKACVVRYPKDISFQEPDSIKINYRLLSPSCETCPDGEIRLRIDGGTPPYSVLWSTNDTATYLPRMLLGKYIVWVTDSKKCRTNSLIDLNMGYPTFQIPNAFTPNGDAVNETWEIAALRDFPSCAMKIYNRAGQLIWWAETGYPVPWDGRDKTGRVLPVGTYYYLLLLDPTMKPIKGSVSILK